MTAPVTSSNFNKEQATSGLNLSVNGSSKSDRDNSKMATTASKSCKSSHSIDAILGLRAAAAAAAAASSFNNFNQAPNSSANAILKIIYLDLLSNKKFIIHFIIVFR